MATPAAVLTVLVNANTGPATAQLSKFDAKLKATTAAQMKTTSAGAGAMRAYGAAAVTTAAVVAGAATKMALDYEESLTKVRNLAGASRKDVEEWGDALLALAPKVGKSPQELADALYFVASSGIKASKVLETTRIAAEGSAIGLGETETVADALTSAMNAYAKAGLSAEEATNILLRTVKFGKLEADDLAQSIGRVLPVASKLKVPFSDVGGALATMSLSGLDAAESTTALRGILSTLLKPTKEGEAALKKVGLSSEELRNKIGQPGGTLEVLKLLGERFKGNDEAMADTFGNVRALTGVFNILGTDQQHVQEIFAGTRKNTDDLGQSMERLSKTPAFKLKQALAFVQAWMVRLGEAILHIAFHDVPKIVDAIEKFWDESKVFQGAVKAMLTIVKTVWTGIKDLFEGGFKIVRGFVKIISGLLTGDWARAWDGVKDVVSGALQGILGVFETFTAPIRGAIKAIADIIRKPIVAAWKWIERASKDAFDFILGGLTMAIDAVAKWADIMSKAPGPIGDAYDEIQTAAEDASDGINHFREKLRQQDDSAKKSAKVAKDTGDSINATLHKGQEVQKGWADSHVKNSKRVRDEQDKLGHKSKDTRDVVVGNVNSMSGGTARGYQEIEGNTNKALKALGAKAVKFGIEKAAGNVGDVVGKQFNKQRGGLIVGGRGSGDKVPAMLEPGEVVLNREAVAAMGGSQRADSINRLIPRFAAGGVVPAVSRVIQMMTSRFPGLAVTSTTGGGHAAGSYHYQGKAVDLAGGDMNAAANWVKTSGLYRSLLEGIHNPNLSVRNGAMVPASLWGASTWGDHVDHIHLALQALGKVSGAGAAKLKRLMLSGPKGAWRTTGQAGLDRVREAANKYIARHQPMTGVENAGMLSGSGPVEAAFAAVAKRLSRSKTATLALGMAGFAESGMRDLSYGDSTSQGALQLLSSTASGLGVSPHDEKAIASLFLLRGFYGQGGANALAAQGLPAHLVAQGVQGSADASGSNYAAQKGNALAWMKRYGLRRGGQIKHMTRSLHEHRRRLREIERHPYREKRIGHLENLLADLGEHPAQRKRLHERLAGLRSVQRQRVRHQGGEIERLETLLPLLRERRGAHRMTRSIARTELGTILGMPYAGAFRTGGTVPGPLGRAQLATVHGGEAITDGSNISVVVHGDIYSKARDPVEVVIGDRRFKAAVRSVRSPGGGRPLPGRAGS